MSSVVCDHCGARFDLQRDSLAEGEMAIRPTCRDCGQGARWLTEEAEANAEESAPSLSEEPEVAAAAPADEAAASEGAEAALAPSEGEAAAEASTTADAVEAAAGEADTVEAAAGEAEGLSVAADTTAAPAPAEIEAAAIRGEDQASAESGGAEPAQGELALLGDAALQDSPDSIEPVTQPAPTVSSKQLAEADAASDDSATAAHHLEAASDAEDTVVTSRPGDVAERALDQAPDSAIPLSTRDFLTGEFERARRLPRVPAGPTLQASDGSLSDAEIEPSPLSLGTPTLAALVERRRLEDPTASSDRFPLPPIAQAPFDASRDPLGMLSARALSEAPVTASAPPPARPEKRSMLPATFAVLALAGAFYAGTNLQRARSTQPSGADAPAAAALPVPQPAQVPNAGLEAPAEPALPGPVMDAPVPAAEAVAPAPITPADAKAPEKERAQEPAPAVATRTVNAATSDLPSSTKPAAPAVSAAPTEAAFDAAAANLAIGRAAAQASNCRKEGDPSGIAVVTLTFSPSGRVTSANVSGPPFAGTATGGCIAATLRGAKVPPYVGDFLTVKKTVTID